MAFDYKKEYKEFYLPPKKPTLVTIPPMNFVAVQGTGDPNEPETLRQMDAFAEAQGYAVDFAARRHHEIYLSDPRRTAPEKCKTVLRHPIRKK